MNILEFELMHKDRVCAWVRYTPLDKIEYKQYSNDMFESIFWKQPKTIENLLLFIDDRCFPRNRVNARQLLDDLGLREYSSLDIVKKTHGVMCSDDFWLRFKGEEYLRYKDVMCSIRKFDKI